MKYNYLQIFNRRHTYQYKTHSVVLSTFIYIYCGHLEHRQRKKLKKSQGSVHKTVNRLFVSMVTTGKILNSLLLICPTDY